MGATRSERPATLFSQCSMSQPWQLVEAVEHGAGRIELRRRGARDYLITLDGRVLMNSAAHLSERALGALAVETLSTRSEPHVLIAGLGMAFTLRGAPHARSPGQAGRFSGFAAGVRNCARLASPVEALWRIGGLGDLRIR